MAIYDDEVIGNQKPIHDLAKPKIRVRNYSGIVISTVHGLCHIIAPLNSELSMYVAFDFCLTCMAAMSISHKRPSCRVGEKPNKSLPPLSLQQHH